MYSGTLIQVMMDKSRSGFGRLGSFSSSFKDGRKEAVRMVFLFTNHLLLTTRASNGRLHLAKVRQSVITNHFTSEGKLTNIAISNWVDVPGGEKS